MSASRARILFQLSLFITPLGSAGTECHWGAQIELQTRSTPYMIPSLFPLTISYLALSCSAFKLPSRSPHGRRDAEPIQNFDNLVLTNADQNLFFSPTGFGSLEIAGILSTAQYVFNHGISILSTVSNGKAATYCCRQGTQINLKVLQTRGGRRPPVRCFSLLSVQEQVFDAEATRQYHIWPCEPCRLERS